MGVLQAELPAGRSQLKEPVASVVIVNRDGRRYLGPCLTAVLEQQVAGAFEVILVDNASTDGSAELVRTDFPTVTVLAAPANLGFAAGNNLGIRESSGRYVVLLNNDTVVQPGWLAALFATADSEQRAGAVQSKLVFADRPQTIQSAGTLLLDDGSGGDRGCGEPADRYRDREEVFAACGAASLYRRAALDDVGLLDESFFMYYEDTDLSWRLRLRGWRVLFEPEAVVKHFHAGTSGADSPFMRFHANRNRLLMLVKNAPLGFLLVCVGRLGRRAAGAEGERMGHSRGAVLTSFLRLLPRAIFARARIRRRRAVADRDILAWTFPRDEWDNRRRC